MILFILMSLCFTIFTSNSESAFDLNQTCSGILFEAVEHPEDPHSFVGCVQGKGSLFRCPNNEFFSKSSLACAEFKDETTTSETTTTTTTTESFPNATDTTTTSSTTKTTTTTTTTTDNPSGVGVTFRCPPDGFGNIPNANDCSRYFECIAGIRYPQTCNGTLLFDIITSTCREPELGFCATNLTCQ
jgi:hypothetical protein